MNMGSNDFMNRNDFNEADLRMQAILYLLDDPSLNAVEFEARLADDDGRLSEILAEAVVELEGLRAAQQVIASRSGSPAVVQTVSPTHVPTPANWTWITALAAGIALAAFIGFRSMRPTPDTPDDLVAGVDDATFNMTEPSDLHLEPFVVHSMISEWAHLQVQGNSERPAFVGSIPESELAWSQTSEVIADREVPDWLVLAASVGDVETTESDLN